MDVIDETTGGDEVAPPSPPCPFPVGTQVCRIEDRVQIRSTVLAVCEGGSVHIRYHEGGDGYWPVDAIRLPTQEELDMWAADDAEAEQEQAEPIVVAEGEETGAGADPEPGDVPV